MIEVQKSFEFGLAQTEWSEPNQRFEISEFSFQQATKKKITFNTHTHTNINFLWDGFFTQIIAIIIVKNACSIKYLMKNLA